MNVVLILGNGADLDLGLKTSFTSFRTSKYWQQYINDKSSKNSELTSFLNTPVRDNREPYTIIMLRVYASSPRHLA